jgi:putative endonuclease
LVPGCGGFFSAIGDTKLRMGGDSRMNGIPHAQVPPLPASTRELRNLSIFALPARVAAPIAIGVEDALPLPYPFLAHLYSSFRDGFLTEIIFLLMASVYILFSERLNRFYVGSCLEFEKRFELHQSRQFQSSFTAKTDDWSLFLRVDDLGFSQARKIEQHIKSMRSKTYIHNLRKFPEIIDKLKKKYARSG